MLASRALSLPVRRVDLLAAVARPGRCDQTLRAEWLATELHWAHPSTGPFDRP
jgi:hypothetical protein